MGGTIPLNLISRRQVRGSSEQPPGFWICRRAVVGLKPLLKGFHGFRPVTARLIWRGFQQIDQLGLAQTLC